MRKHAKKVTLERMSEVKSAEAPSPHKQEVYLSAEHRVLLVTRCFYQTAQKTVVVVLLKNFSTLSRVPKVGFISETKTW